MVYAVQASLFRSTRQRPLEVRFWEKVDRSGGPDACWPWLGGCTTRRYGSAVYRYGQIRAGAPSRRVLLAHRVALIFATGEAPPELDACHRCDNTLCCNNERHLFWGTHRENMRDYAAKYGRLGVGKTAPLAPRPTLPFVSPAFDEGDGFFREE